MPEKLHQTHLVAAVVTRTGLSRKQACTAVKAILDSVTQSLKEGEPVDLRGLGTLEVRPTAPRTGVRPATGEKIELPAGRKVVFRITPDLQGQL